jgi:hypothetical protein
MIFLPVDLVCSVVARERGNRTNWRPVGGDRSVWRRFLRGEIALDVSVVVLVGLVRGSAARRSGRLRHGRREAPPKLVVGTLNVFSLRDWRSVLLAWYK